MYSGDIYSCSVGNPFISDSETNHIINSHTHSEQLEKQSVSSVPEGLSEISSLAWKTLSLTPSLYEIIISLHFFAFACVSTPWWCFILELPLLFIFFYLIFSPWWNPSSIIDQHIFPWWASSRPYILFPKNLAYRWSGESNPPPAPLLFPLDKFVDDCISSIHLYQYT